MGEQARIVFWDSTTLPKVWKSESQHSQIVFPLWEFKSHGVSILLTKSANNKWCPNWAIFGPLELEV